MNAGPASLTLPHCSVLWRKDLLRGTPSLPAHVGPERSLPGFIELSVGHASMLLYAILHQCGVGAVNARYERLGEGEAASLAGHLRLSNLCWIYDNNKISIEGHTSLAFSEDVATRFIGYGWNVTRVGDANDLEMLL